MKIVIVGNGVAGITCAMAARQRDADASIAVISGETDYFFSRTALMYSYMDLMTRRDLEPYERHSYTKQRIELVRDWVVGMDADKKTVTLENGGARPYDKLVFAVGATPNVFPWKGFDQIKEGKVHLVSMQDLDDCERLTPTTREAVVIGGGLIGIELVECLRFHGVKVTFLIREPWYWPMALGREEAEYVTEHMREHGVDVRLNEEMTEAHVDSNGRVSSITTSKGNTIPCQMLGIAAGVHPSTERLKKFDIAFSTRGASEEELADPTPKLRLGRGIIVNEYLETPLPDVYACGDCAEIHPEGGKPYGELIWYSAKRQGLLVGARNVFGDKIPYTPPLFFNSSKFFEIEYTTVGDIMKRAKDGLDSIYLKIPGKSVSIRIVHENDSVVGFNMLGSRWNHEILERWIHERRSPKFVVANLRAAQYDVEFGRMKISKMTRKDLPLENWT